MRAGLVRKDEHGVTSVEDRLESGDYDRLLADFRKQMDEAIAALRAHQDAMRDGFAPHG